MVRIRDGSIWLDFQDLNDKDLKAILLKCSIHSRERRPRKCRQLGSKNVVRILSMLPINNVTRFNVVGNRRRGDAGTEHLHLLPPTIEDLDLSDCGITLQGVKSICEFMKTNKSITRLIMWNSGIRDDEHSATAVIHSTYRGLCNCNTTDAGARMQKALPSGTTY